MKNFLVRFRIENTPGINSMSREEVVCCINQNEAKEILSRKYGVDKNHIGILGMKPC